MATTFDADKRRSLGSEATTRGVRIVVSPRYLPEQSDPGEGRRLFGYRVRIENHGDRWVKLLRRRWLIIDATGERNEVRGDGVIGVQPELDVGDGFEYESYCPLQTSWGTMEGAYSMRDDTGAEFDARVERFYLVADPE